MKVNRWFVRCNDCCSTVAVEQDPMELLYWQGQACTHRYVGPACSCGGLMHSLGRVSPSGQALHIDEVRCACDHRCTGATGPNCNCSCGGDNHGTGRTVLVTLSTAGIPTVSGGSPERAQELRDAVAAAQARIDALPFAADIKAGKWVSDKAAWKSVCDAQSRLARVKHLQTHKGRMIAVAKV